MKSFKKIILFTAAYIGYCLIISIIAFVLVLIFPGKPRINSSDYCDYHYQPMDPAC